MNKVDKQYVIVIDAGTQSVRAVLIDLQGNICEIERTEVEPYYSDQPGYAEQDPEYLWHQLCQTSKRLISNTSVWVKNSTPNFLAA